MTSSPYFSIVIPTYNREEFILNTLNTVFNQVYTNYEVIVVDNCSTDNTLEVLQPLIDEGKIRFIQHDKNYERAKSRNTGMQHAQGEYLTFLDSDDFMYPNNLQDAYDYSIKHPDKQAFHNLYELVDEHKTPLHTYTFASLSNPKKQISRGNFLSCIGVFIRREVYQNVAWDENELLTGSEDYDFWLRVIAHTSDLGRIDKVNSGILEHSGRTVNTNVQQIDKAKERFVYFRNKIDRHEAYQSYGHYKKSIKATLWLYLAYMARQAKQRSLSATFLKEAFKADKTILYRRDTYSFIFYLIKSLFSK
jgi:glycosyltransferase involved in cell wall biosynthesis